MAIQHRSKPIRALEREHGTEYNEETFLHLLAIEQARAERSNQQVQLLLATLEPVPGKPVQMPSASAARVFEGLRLLLRETDVVGWYRQARVAGAVLSARADASAAEESEPIEQRVRKGLRERLPSKIARSLRVRVTQQGPRRVVNE